MNLALARIRRLYPRLPMRIRGGGSLSGGPGALARREVARLGRALAQQTLDRPADDGIRMPRKGELVDLRFKNDKPYRIEPKSGRQRCLYPSQFRGRFKFVAAGRYTQGMG